MIRKIIHIDKNLCNGCGLCAQACHENAIQMIDGKAVLTREDYCDGLGDCLPACPVQAITFEEREAPAYDHQAVERNKKQLKKALTSDFTESSFSLSQWPIQIKLAPINAPYFSKCNLLIAADCSGYAYGNFHREFVDGKITLIGCPKLDAVYYGDKLASIFASNDIRTVTVTRMEVPCCQGIEAAVADAIRRSKKNIPCTVATIGINGEILSSKSI
ncbi:MAG TPA: 4Fe-4S binding protein [Candidatus Hungatella pullicola]|nr:4Fe-4S binding protein [Candidatus Hungatella pullicola]